MKKITILQSSLREGSHTSIVCKVFEQKCRESGLDVNYIDLKDIELQFCDARNIEEYNDDLQSVYKKLDESEAIVFGMPVYQYSMSGVLKNIIDICGGTMKAKPKPIGVIVNAGGPNGYMASRDLFDCLYYEYGCTNITPTPYTWSMDFKDGELVNEKVIVKLNELVEKIISL